MAKKSVKIDTVPLPEKTEWKTPFLRILEGHEDLLRATSEFPKLGKLPSLGKIPHIEVRSPYLERIGIAAASPVVAVVVVVVCVAVAARPGAVTSPELLRAKLLDVYSLKERAVLREAVTMVQKNPELINSTLGIEPTELGRDFMGRLKQVQEALQ